MNKKSSLDLHFDSPSKRITAAVLAAILIILCFVTNHLPSLHWFAPTVYLLLGITWVVGYQRFFLRKKYRLISIGSLPLIIIGLVAALLSVFAGHLFSYALQNDFELLCLLLLLLGISFLRFQTPETVCIVSFMLFPYAVFSISFFLITGFLSAVLLLIGFFNGTLWFEDEKLDEDEYFGNSNQ